MTLKTKYKIFSAISAVFIWFYIMGDLGYQFTLFSKARGIEERLFEGQKVMVLSDPAEAVLSMEVLPPAVDLRVSGFKKKIRELNPEEFSPYVDVRGYGPGRYEVILNMIHPKGIKVQPATNVVEVVLKADWAEQIKTPVLSTDLARSFRGRFMKSTLGVNVDHVATLREARKISEPDPVQAAVICELAGCHGITVHLREDRRHIQQRDVTVLKDLVKTRLNLEMSLDPDIVNFACALKPHQVTLVPENRQEVTTEGGLDVLTQGEGLTREVKRLQNAGVVVSLFVDPEPAQIEASLKTGAQFIEIHTGQYAHAVERGETFGAEALKRVREAARMAQGLGLRVNAGHGLNLRNVQAIAAIDAVEELNIGHALIGHALFVGLKEAVQSFLRLIESA